MSTTKVHKVQINVQFFFCYNLCTVYFSQNIRFFSFYSYAVFNRGLRDIYYHFILERVMLVMCERWTGDRSTLLYWPQVLLATTVALLPHLGLVAQPWVNEGCKPSVCRLILMLASCLQLTQAICALVILLFNVHLLLVFFRLFTQVHLLIDGSGEGQHITLVGCQWKKGCFQSRCCYWWCIWRLTKHSSLGVDKLCGNTLLAGRPPNIPTSLNQTTHGQWFI